MIAHRGKRPARLAGLLGLCAAVLAACAGTVDDRAYRQAIDHAFAGALQIVSLRKLYPSAPFASWAGRYGLTLRDVDDQESFLVSFSREDAQAAVLAQIRAARALKHGFVQQQQAALAVLHAQGLAGDFFTLHAPTVYGTTRWRVVYVASLQALRDGEPFINAQALQAMARIVDSASTPEPVIDILAAEVRTDYAPVLAKQYHGMLEMIGGQALTYRQSVDSGTDLLARVSPKISPAGHIVPLTLARLREAGYAEIERQIASNQFHARWGLYLLPLYRLLEGEGLARQLRQAGLRQGHSAFALLDRPDQAWIIRGVATDERPTPDGTLLHAVYGYVYELATRRLTVHEIAHQVAGEP